LNKIADVDDVVIFQAICRTDRKLKFVDFTEQIAVKRQFFLLFLDLNRLRLFEGS